MTLAYSRYINDSIKYDMKTQLELIIQNQNDIVQPSNPHSTSWFNGIVDGIKGLATSLQANQEIGVENTFYYCQVDKKWKDKTQNLITQSNQQNNCKFDL